MRVYTAHIRAAAPPVLVPEGFAFWGLVFGPAWLLWQAAWIPAVLAFAAEIVLQGATPEPARLPLGVALSVLIGLFGQDLRRWSLHRRGFALAQVVAAQGREAALARLLDRRPDLLPARPPEATPA